MESFNGDEAFNVYVGDTSKGGAYQSENNNCYSGNLKQGVFTCEAVGEYIIFDGESSF